MDNPKPIPPHLLFTFNNRESLEEIRRDTANYYIAHNCFEYDVVTLMEIAYILCIQSGRLLDADETHSKHNRLCKKIIENDMPYCHKDIREKPYFKNMQFEYWVSPEIALKLINPEKIKPKMKKGSRRSQLLLSYAEHYISQGIITCDQYIRIMKDKHYINNGNGFIPSTNNTDNSHPNIRRAHLKPSRTKNGNKKADLYYQSFNPSNGNNELSDSKHVSIKKFREYFALARKNQKT